MYVPCGKCGFCMKRKVSDWIFRINEHAAYSAGCYFVTLTYASDPLQLYKKDLQNLFKRMRKAGATFQYYAVGEYGSLFGRPHYHVLFFGLEASYADSISTYWSLGSGPRSRGFVHVAALSFANVSYTVRYMSRYVDYDKRLSKPFMLCSKRPAIGSGYVDRMRQWHKSNKIFHCQKNQYKVAMPRYYRDRIFNRVERNLHTQQNLLDSMYRRDAEVQRLSKFHSNPDFYYVEKEMKQSDLLVTSFKKISKTLKF